MHQLCNGGRSRRGRLRRPAGVGILLVLAIVAAGCSSSSNSSSSQGASSGTNEASAPGITPNSVTVGLFSDFTGSQAAGFTTVPIGFNARIALQNAEGGVYGRQIKITEGDTTSTTTGALTAAQTLVSKNAFAVAAISVVMFAAQPYLTKEGIPVIGAAIDGPEWSPPNNNMFPVNGSPSANFPAPVNYGTFFKAAGATNVGAIALNVPSAVAAAYNMRSSAEHAGLKATYINTTVPLTQEGNFGSVVQAMQQQKTDAVWVEMQPAANFAFLRAARQAGLNAVFLLDQITPQSVFQNPQALADAQGTWAYDPYVPTALNTPATQAYVAALKKYQGYTQSPDLNLDFGWAMASAFITGLKAAGRNPTRASYTSALRAVNNFTDDGLAINPVSFTASFGTGAEGPGPAPQACAYYGQFKGHQFVWQTKPVCGGLVPNSNAPHS